MDAMVGKLSVVNVVAASLNASNSDIPPLAKTCHSKTPNSMSVSAAISSSAAPPASKSSTSSEIATISFAAASKEASIRS